MISRISAIPMIIASLVAQPLLAADFFDNPQSVAMPSQQVEVGSNWYIRGDVGYDLTKENTVQTTGLFPTDGNQPIGNANSPVPISRGDSQAVWAPVFQVGFGYRVNDSLRLEADWQYSKGPGLGVQHTVYCPEVANAVSNYEMINGTATGVPVGYVYDVTQCDGALNVSQYNNTGLLMSYIDLGHWGGLTPFVGFGTGLNVNTITGTLTFNQQDTGVTYSAPAASGSAPGVWVVQSGTQNGYPYYTPLPKTSSGNPQPVGPGVWNRKINSTKYTFAAAVAAGVGFNINSSATLDLAYKFTTLDISNMKNTVQGVNLGLRYNLN